MPDKYKPNEARGTAAGRRDTNQAAPHVNPVIAAPLATGDAPPTAKPVRRRRPDPERWKSMYGSVYRSAETEGQFSTIMLFSLSGLTVCVFALGFWPVCGDFLLP
jgi:hypothetical protein